MFEFRSLVQADKAALHINERDVRFDRLPALATAVGRHRDVFVPLQVGSTLGWQEKKSQRHFLRKSLTTITGDFRGEDSLSTCLTAYA